MCKIFKKLVIALLVCSVSIIHVNALDKNVDGFEKMVKSTEYYKRYKDEIDSVYVKSVNDQGVYVVAYILEEYNDGNKTLVFSGNSDYSLKDVLIVDVNNSTASTINLLSNQTIRAHLGYCVEDTCKKYVTVPQYSTNIACSTIIGQNCQPLYGLPSYFSFLYLLCRGGVFVGCNISTTKKCTAWTHSEYECSIP